MIETSDTAESGGEGYFGKGEVGVGEQFFCREQTMGSGEGLGRGTIFSFENATQMSVTNSQPVGQVCNQGKIALVCLKRYLFDQVKSAFGKPATRIYRSMTGSQFRATLQTGAEAALFGLGLTLEESTVFGAGGSGGANRSTIDTCRCHPDEENPVEASVSGG